MNELPAGRDAVLLDFAAEDDSPARVRHAAEALRRAADAGELAHLDEVIPSDTTILVQFESDSGADILGIHRALRGTAEVHQTGSEFDEISVPVHYDGEDLGTVAELLGTITEEVVRMHRNTRWRVQFMGFAPGFGYLVPQDDPSNPLMRVGRRTEPRTRVPTGAVAVAAGYSAVYPRTSPGGWYLLGHTDVAMWNTESSPPALLTPGALIRFVDVEEQAR